MRPLFVIALASTGATSLAARGGVRRGTAPSVLSIARLLLRLAGQLPGEQVAERRALRLGLLRGQFGERLALLLVVHGLDRERDLLFGRVDAQHQRAHPLADL